MGNQNSKAKAVYEPKILKKDNVEKTLEMKGPILSQFITSAVYGIIYFPNLQKIVACDRNNLINVIDSRTFKTIEKISVHSGWVIRVVKWDDETFLSCSCDKSVCAFSTVTHETKKHFTFFQSEVYRIEKLSDDLFVTVDWRRDITIVSYSTEKVVKKYHFGLFYVCEILKSKYFENCFYLLTGDEVAGVRLINYERNLVIKEFIGHSKSEELVHTISLFKNTISEEIVVVVGEENRIVFYNAMSNFYDCKKKTKDFKITKRRSSTDNSEKTHFYSSMILSNRYLCCGQKSGDFVIYDINLSCDGLIEVGRCENLCGNQINGFCLIGKDIEDNLGVTFACCSERGGIVTVNVKGMILDDKLSESSQDLEERIQFLRDQSEEFVFSEIDQKNMFFSIELTNSKITKLYRFLLTNM